MTIEERQVMLLNLLNQVEVVRIIGRTDLLISSICNNSKTSGEGSLFVAVVGSNADGHQYIGEAVLNGAKAIVCQNLPENLAPEVTYVHVTKASLALAQIADAFYDHPSRKLKLVAVTGTSGKTTTTYLLHHIFTSLGYKTGMLSSIENRVGLETLDSELTTPDAITINRFLSKMVSCGVKYCFMEASSHAIDQYRVAALEFVGAVFMNITREHLDYHRTFGNYILAKKKLFDSLPPTAFAVVNVEDKRSSVVLQNTSARIYTFGVKSSADFKLKVLSNTIEGLELKFDNEVISTKLVGEFNAYNIIAAYGAAILLGMEKVEVMLALTTAPPVPGRFEYMRAPNGLMGVVDFAHKPDALSNVLLTVKKVKPKNSRIILVIGCGGNRCKDKRPVMAFIACKYSHIVILTSDNPRFEDPQSILDEMMTGVPAQKRASVITILNRREAIEHAVDLANSEDIIVLAGKGHENCQIVGDVRLPFSDKKVFIEHTTKPKAL